MPTPNYTPLDLSLLNGKSKSYTPISRPLETEPPTPKAEGIKIHEVIEHSVEDVDLEKHIDVKKETVELPEEIKKMGVEANPPTQFPAYQALKLPISDERIEQGLHKPVSSSWRWLAELCLYMLRQVHLKLKNIHGKIVRIKAA